MQFIKCLYKLRFLYLLGTLFSPVSTGFAETQAANGVEGEIEYYLNQTTQLMKNKGMSTPELMEPLVSLGRGYLLTNRPQLAVQVLEQAIQISRIELGLHNLRQLAMIDYLSEAHAALGNLDEAHNRQLYRYFLSLEQEIEDLSDMLAAISHLAGWSVKLRKYAEARQLYLRMIKLIESSYGTRSPRLISPFRKIAATYLRERDDYVNAYPQRAEEFDFTSQGKQVIWSGGMAERQTITRWLSGERMLRKVIQLQLLDPQTSVIELIRSHIDLGDWHTLLYRPLAASEQYRRAILLLEQLPPESLPESFFEQPKLLFFPNLNLRPMSRVPGSRNLPGFVELIYSVNEQGEVNDIEVSAAKPQDPPRKELKKVALLTRYRPAFRKDRAIATMGVTHRHEYYRSSSGIRN